MRNDTLRVVFLAVLLLAQFRGMSAQTIAGAVVRITVSAQDSIPRAQAVRATSASPSLLPLGGGTKLRDGAWWKLDLPSMLVSDDGVGVTVEADSVPLVVHLEMADGRQWAMFGKQVSWDVVSEGRRRLQLIVRRADSTHSQVAPP